MPRHLFRGVLDMIDSLRPRPVARVERRDRNNHQDRWRARCAALPQIGRHRRPTMLVSVRQSVMWPVGGASILPKEHVRCHFVPERSRIALLTGKCQLNKIGTIVARSNYLVRSQLKPASRLF